MGIFWARNPAPRVEATALQPPSIARRTIFSDQSRWDWEQMRHRQSVQDPDPLAEWRGNRFPPGVGTEQPCQISDHTVITVGLDENTVNKVGTRQVKVLFGDGFTLMFRRFCASSPRMSKLNYFQISDSRCHHGSPHMRFWVSIYCNCLKGNVSKKWDEMKFLFRRESDRPAESPALPVPNPV